MDRGVNFMIKMLFNIWRQFSMVSYLLYIFYTVSAFYKMFSRIFMQKIYLENRNSVTTAAKVG